MTRRVRIVGLAAMLLCPLAGTSGTRAAAEQPKPGGTSVYVATNGDDTWSGRLPAPNGARTDGPFATIERAQRAARERKSAEAPVTVQVRGGLYSLTKPLVFTPEDSGTTYSAYRTETPVISGGTRLTGWTKNALGRWTLHLPEVERGGWYFSQLWVNGERRYRPRASGSGYSLIAEALPPSPKAKGQGYDRFKFHEGDIRGDWHNLDDVEVLCFQLWTMARMRVAAVDDRHHDVTFTAPTQAMVDFFSLGKGRRYIVENVQEALHEPGEWYLDRRSGDLTYIPMAGETPESAEVIAPRLDRLALISGDPINRNWVSNLAFRGLVFAHSNWNCPASGNLSGQAECNLGAAISAVGARDCSLQRCAVTHVGEYAVEFGVGCKRCSVTECALTDLAAGGVKLGEMGGHEDDELLASNNTVRNCLIAHGGRMHPAAIGVWIGASPFNTVAHNEIGDLYYTGISVGWSWGYSLTASHHNILEYNHIHDIGQRVLSDMGGTYTLGLAPGTVQRYNVIHDVSAFAYGGWGIYFDEGTTGMLAENNVVYRTRAGFHQHYGQDNIVRNCIFAYGTEAEVMRTRVENHISFNFEHNIVYWREGPLLGSNWSGNNYKLNSNIYWNAAGKPFNFAGLDLAKWRAKGQDTDSLIADPMFVRPERGDFRLKPGSPAAAIGFHEIDTRRVGPEAAAKAAARRRKAPFDLRFHAAQRRAFPDPPPAS